MRQKAFYEYAENLKAVAKLFLENVMFEDDFEDISFHDFIVDYNKKDIYFYILCLNSRRSLLNFACCVSFREVTIYSYEENAERTNWIAKNTKNKEAYRCIKTYKFI